MKDDADILIARMNRLLELTELARHAAPKDRARMVRTIDLAGQALLAVAHAREVMERAETAMVLRRDESLF